MAQAERIALRPGPWWLRFMLVPHLLLLSVVPLGIAKTVAADEWGWASGIVLMGVLIGVIGWRRLRVRLVADDREVLVFNSFRTWHIPWALIVAFAIRPGRPGRSRAIGVYLDDDTAISAEATIYWSRGRMLERCADLERMRLARLGENSR